MFKEMYNLSQIIYILFYTYCTIITNIKINMEKFRAKLNNSFDLKKAK